MEIKTDLEMKLDGVTCSVENNYGLLHIQCDVFQRLTDLQHDEKIFSWIDRVEHEKDLSGILMLNEPGCFGHEAYNRFLSNVSGIDLDQEHPKKISGFQNSQTRAIEVNMLMTFIKKFVNFPKLVVSCLRGEVVTPFIGMNLVTDFRVMSSTAFFNLSHVAYGLHPSGALPFLLPKYIGQGKAEELLLRGGKISAEEALKMGLVSDILNDENFVEECKTKAKILFAIDRNVVKTTKDLMFNYKKDLYRYFDQEGNYLFS